jgi:hypothetical protein
MPATQPHVVLTHGEVEAELRAIPPRRITSLWGRRVHRLDLLHWSVEGSLPLRLLPAIDQLMSQFAALETLEIC